MASIVVPNSWSYCRQLLFGLVAVLGGCAPSEKVPSNSGAARNLGQAERQSNPTRRFLPFSLEHVTGGAEFGLVESHGMKGEGWFWEFVSPNGRTGIDVEAIDASHLTQVKISISGAGRPRNLACDLNLLQAHVRRILPDQGLTASEWLGRSGAGESFPKKKFKARFCLS